jgi:Protein of unknown function (DUF1573)
MSFTKHLLILLTGFCLTSFAYGQLKFEQTELELHPSPADANAVAHFKYENTGSKPIHIASVQTSCGCTVATLKTNDVAPGDKGDITATLNIGNRTGTQTKAITVNTDDPAHPQTVLTLRAVIPTLLEVQPIFVFWKQDEAMKAKVINVKAPKDSPVKKITVTSTDPDITAKVESAGAKEWKINVVPKDKAKLHNATLTITPDFPPNAPKLFYATARVISPSGGG